MSTTTTDNLALIKEGSDEPVRNHRSNANSNMDAIDAAVKDLQDAIDNAKALLGSLGLDGSGDPVVSKAEALATLGAAASSHNHAAGDITSGTLAIARGGTNAGTAAAARTNLDAAQDASSGTTLYAAQQAISGLAAAQGSVPSGKTLQGEIQTLQDSVGHIKDIRCGKATTTSIDSVANSATAIVVFDYLPDGTTPICLVMPIMWATPYAGQVNWTIRDVGQATMNVAFGFPTGMTATAVTFFWVVFAV